MVHVWYCLLPMLDEPRAVIGRGIRQIAEELREALWTSGSGSELLRELTFTGTPAELQDRVRALRNAGYQQIAVSLVPGHESALEDWVRVLEKA
jgi:esterase/lipase